MPVSLGLAITFWLLTALITWGWIKLAQAKQIHDQPERRRLHQTFTPRAGGISIALMMLLVSVLIYLGSNNPHAYWLLIVVAIALFAALGFWDDLKPLRSRRKLLLHLSVVGLIFLVCRFSVSLGFTASLFISLAYLLFVNIWNFMDGSNGMIAFQSLLYVIGFLALSDFTYDSYYYALALAACCLGFLPFNFPFARVFLGDVGSHVLGAAVVGLALLAYFENQWKPLEILCLFSVLWIDALLTFVRRSLRGFKVTQPHRSHLYQYAIRCGTTHAAICAYYSAWTIAVITVIGINRLLPASSQPILLFGVIAIGCALHQGLRLFVLKSSRNPKIQNSNA
ncbi:MAG: glycosyltransferase family 4 protein [Arenimonas sp.]